MKNFNNVGMSHRTFGVEIEFVGNLNRVLAELNANGINCKFENYNHTTTSRWKIVTDSSVRDSSGNRGLELVSPPLSGINGLKELKKACAALQEADAKVNKTCGLHVHHDMNDATVKQFQGLFYLYARHEGVFDSVMPVSRRGNNNIYCRSIETMVLVDKIKAAESVNDLKAIFPTEASRYCKLNFRSYLRHGTIEFRQHSGTIEFEKIAHWVLLTQAMVRRAFEDRRLMAPHKNTVSSWGRLMKSIGRYVTKETKKFFVARQKYFATAAAA